MGARILVADDSVTIQKVVELTFSKENFTLIQVRSGEETIRKAKEIHPDLILLDLVMPDKDGYEVCAALRDDPTLRTVPIILLTGTFESFDRQRGAEAGANDFVSKPFESQVLIGKVKQLLFAKTLDTEMPERSPGPSTDATTPTIPQEPPGPEPSMLVMAPPLFEEQSPGSDPGVIEDAARYPHDDLQQLLESIPDQAGDAVASEAPGELRLEDLSMTAAPEVAEVEALDLESLGLVPSQIGPALPALEPLTASAAGAGVVDSPAHLSLNDTMWEAGSEESAAAPEVGEPARAPDAPDRVFELAATEALPLPMVEAGKGEPPTLSVEDLLGPTISAIAISEPAAREFPELDLDPLPEEAPPAAQLSAEPLPSAERFELEAPTGLPPEETARSSEAGPADLPVQTEAFDFVSSLPGLEGMPGFAAPVEPAIPMESVPVQALEMVPAEAGTAMAAVEAEAAMELATPSEEGSPASPASMPVFDVTAMREAVTTRVAHDLTQELRERLLERFEKIVWEVVPDLAELLITKEIERIRRLAEEEKEQLS